eukprot:gene4865-5333_t
MSFTFGSSSTNPSSAGGAAGASSGFSFGGASNTSFSFGAPTTAPGTSTGQSSGTSFSFGGAAPTFGAAAAPAAGSTPALSFGAPASTATPSSITPAFGLTGGSAAPAASTGAAPGGLSFGFGAAKPSEPAKPANAPSLSFGSTTPSFGAAATTAPTASGFSFGSAATSAASAPAAPSTAASAATPSFGFGAPTNPSKDDAKTAAAPSFGMGGFGALSTPAAGGDAKKDENKPTGALSFGFGASMTTPAANNKQDETKPAFGFGAAVSDAKKEDNKAAPAAISFGALPSADSNKKEDSKSGSTSVSFGFGAPAAITGSTEQKKDGDGKKDGALSFGFGAPSTQAKVEEKKGDGSTTGAASTVATSSGPIAKGPSPEYSALDIKSIIQQWYRELAQDAMDFESQAHRVNTWDRQLRENQKTLENVVENVHRIMATHSDLKQACETIEAYQVDLEADIQNLSNTLEMELSALQLQEPSEDDFEREKTFLEVETLHDALSQMEVALKKIVSDYNRSNGLGEGASASNENPLVKIVSVLNSHQESLLWLDEKTKQLHSNIEELRGAMGNGQL